MVCLARAEGGKPRLGGQLLPGVVAPIVGASTRALLLKLPTQSPAMSGLYCFPQFTGTFPQFRQFRLEEESQGHIPRDEEPITSFILWW
jgi:hypothetical protein